MLGKCGRRLLPYVLLLPRGEWAFDMDGMLAVIRGQDPAFSGAELIACVTEAVRKRAGPKGRVYFLTAAEFEVLKNARGRTAPSRA